MDQIAKLLKGISSTPSNDEDYAAWLEMKDIFSFIESERQLDFLAVYASLPYCFMHAVAVPTSLLATPDREDLMAWNCNAYSSWSIWLGSGDLGSVSIEPPLNDSCSKVLSSGEQLVFARDFDGRVGDDKCYVEVLQKFTHLSGLHYLEERNAYCRLDLNGDIEEVIRVVKIPAVRGEAPGRATLFRRSVLHEYLTLTDSTLVRMLDFTRYKSPFDGWKVGHDRGIRGTDELFYRFHIDAGYASYMRGCQIIRSDISRDKLIAKLQNGDDTEKQYVSFVAHDWKHNVIKEISCAPGHTANYFTDSDLPFETSPVFFKPEVLGKYKANTDKYTLSDRSITCRGAWDLQTYDVNEAGQVHTYIVYLSHLPYEEQLYWKSFNEKPEGHISQRALKTDFEGAFDTEYEPLSNLKFLLAELETNHSVWWKLRSTSLPDRVHYPVTESPDDWANELLQLDQFVVEGFETKWLREKANKVGRVVKPDSRSLHLIQECLIGLGLSEDDAKSVVLPLKELTNLRSKLKGHASGEEAIAIRKKCLSKYGSYKAHFKSLCADVDASLRRMSVTFQKLT